MVLQALGEIDQHNMSKASAGDHSEVSLAVATRFHDFLEEVGGCPRNYG